ncbi:addiction module antidote protein [Xylanimonas cellulosilytica DSM 15894]|uniref:Addiction module antidote protein n=1 Tax=Xylanimonas cellulosilytica (strain DSM 15894 / JCM 12276 / CECT 5975 / KCTC 9989 / LMG 20990 / NBRC 107835 / XIL07) TaxID=446471 RepID=D1BRK1_XYLCX|nr:addiction module antidote protein [Xylanimonas cellulosilytica]ACZ32267.1 addiction module antidote protein [Xylanimonas cellulosilytica DSM 15894]
MNAEETFDRYDSADYLTDADDAAAYLEAALEEAGDDPAFIAQALGTIARSGNMSELARRVGVSREGLYKALASDGNPSFATVVKVAKALGLSIHFEPAA